MEFYQLKVKEITPETKDTVTLEFDIPAELSDKFAYKHGQYITMRKEMDGHELRRSYSMSSSPLDNKLAITVKKVPGAADVALEQATGLPILTIQPQLDKMARHGITMNQLQDTLATAFGGQVAAQFYEGDKRSDIVVRLPENLRTNIDAMASMPIMLSKGSSSLAEGSYVPLGELVTFEKSIGYNQIYRENGKRRIVVTANAAIIC